MEKTIGYGFQLFGRTRRVSLSLVQIKLKASSPLFRPIFLPTTHLYDDGELTPLYLIFECVILDRIVL